MAEQYQMVSENPESTVVAEFEPGYYNAAQYQSEAEMESDFIKRLTRQAYEYLTITSEKELIANLRHQIERLNNIIFEDKEWSDFFNEFIGNPNMGIVEKTKTIQEDNVKAWTRPDGSLVNVSLIDKINIHNNSLQVINQYVPEGGAFDNRYDVTILVNGLPLVHVELKRRGVSIKDAFNQIDRYQRDSFWAGSGLYEFVQIFVISNGTLTKYYSNTTRDAVSKANQKNGKGKGKKQTSNSFEFTSYWATKNNEPVYDLMDFTQTFFSKHTLLNILTKYCVFTSENLLLVMRPYQIAATEEILLRIKTSTNAKTYGKREGGGYIWHTTGSGKTLTSFKTARLASRLDEIDKVLFVVDRKDLDYQTMKEYDRFEKGAANSNGSTAVLKKQLDDPNARIIITTIQKLSNFIARNPQHKVYGQHTVLIFDECHRSQFGDMHKAITKKFKKYHMFGFTGTPIFPDNAGAIRNVEFTTTEGAFGDQLHSYTIVDAIRDQNVLPFKVDYIRTMREEDEILDEQVSNIDRERALMAPERISLVSKYIMEHFAQKTRRDARSYTFSKLTNVGEVATAKDRNKVKEIKAKTRLTGFNSIFAVASIPFVKLYYSELQRHNKLLPPDKRLKIATIFSYSPNVDTEDESPEDTDGLDQPSRDFLEKCIEDYNDMFGTSYDTSADKFQNYYKDLSLRMKNREVDLLIVVNMFLTGFDATTLNTLWVDKNLRYHGLLQAYSRTNRILNSIKDHGNIVCFRNLEKATNDCLQLFGNKDAAGLILLKTFDDYFFGYDDEQGKHHPGWKELIEELLAKYPLGTPILGETAEKEFIKLFGTILRAYNILVTFDEFADNHIISDDDFVDYRGFYNELHDKYRPKKGELTNINDDLVFEMELMKSIEINIDYILFLVGQLDGDENHDREIIIKAMKSVEASPDLRNKKELIEDFIESHTPENDVHDQWHEFVRQSQQQQIEDIITAENIKRDKTFDFVSQSFREGGVKESGTAIAEILPPMGLFGGAGAKRAEKKKSVIAKLKDFFDRFFDISGGEFYRPE
ncbi:type I restriction endonuclease subunit R [Alistipes sp. Z76]|jgi:type I restriction enzyme R subunit|uniref:type I restriction endonuclease subunit R n=1 Tax=Heminiphilus faecis TaxID=2601703 RepID=UPI0012489874|nr:type I restriction endonuclease subunit R [Heminiphilus faecis]NBJ09061.1 type I restriction endonuclease subunit R [Alistipes sp. Z76]NCE71066.1 type I restriction endonuclease subunit R [Muribaculaceae bacterium M3]